ncbi:hypothetical protein ER308_17095 [Egibacter rhizosphaerae]|uniref:Septum formation initiator family protein n=1 Tax=Egibacter rhizosphaerae TaxID=1670831 RepID=A0A411YIU6_9ACTN|nr:septum formation initiator family protein [Egibacter rhizosphaerae]QBI21117.1 hypothetical protein ER308_17095 [Egibacter rhizosphaerae]
MARGQRARGGGTRDVPAGSRRGASRLRDQLFKGDRPFVLLFVGLVVAIAVVAIGPVQVFSEAAQRVDELEAERDELREEADELEERERRLKDPDELELLARGELGLVRPGEDPVVVVPDPDVRDDARDEAEDAEPAGESDEDEEDAPWWRRAGRWLGEHLAGE